MSAHRESSALLEVDDLCVNFTTTHGVARIVDKISFALQPGRTLGVVGESGSGKSVMSRAIMRLLPQGGTVCVTGAVRLEGKNLLNISEREMRGVRGRRISMIFQDPMSCLNPVKKIGPQVTEVLRLHLGMNRTDALKRAIWLLGAMGIPDPQMTVHLYPRSLSGGMRQRVAIAIALACEPALLIADEPTTALDVTIQAQILDLLREQQKSHDMAMLFITHNLGLVANYADEVAVMYAGRMVEYLPSAGQLTRALMPYTQALLRSQPNLSDPPHTRLATVPGTAPPPTEPMSGCRFAARCSRRIDPCVQAEPPLEDGRVAMHRYACWNPSDGDSV